MTIYIARIYLEDEYIELAPTTSFAQALKDKEQLNKDYEGLYIEKAKIYKYEY